MVLTKFLIRVLETCLVGLAQLLWYPVQVVNHLLPGRKITPDWAPEPLLKESEKSMPNTGWPREVNSLCPECVKTLRRSILNNEQSVDAIINGNPAEIKAQIFEEEGRLYMKKSCPNHGEFLDIMSLDVRFNERMETLSPKRDFISAVNKIRNHGSSTIKYGRGSVMTIDLTNRCNMMCNPCFTNANQIGYVHELSLDDCKKILDDSTTIKPHRQLSVQFSGGEPTLSPIFIDAIKYAKSIGYYSVQAATNGIRFAQDPKFAQEAAEAGLRIAYLQFDGVGNENHAHRKINNLFDVKLQAIENLYAAGVEIVLVVTVVNTINNHQVEPIVQFAIDNADKICFIAFQPVSFTGRDEDIDDETRFRNRYTLTHLSRDVNRALGVPENSVREWLPLAAASAFSDIADVLKGTSAEWGTMKCSCHPNCGSCTAIIINKATKDWAPMAHILNVDQIMTDLPRIADKAHGHTFTMFQMGLSLVRNYRPWAAPGNLNLVKMIKKFDKQSGGGLGGKLGARDDNDRRQDEWMILFIGGMWFQDLFNYDFSRTEMCVIPYGTQWGEISFCAHNTGYGWRQLIEKKMANANVADWFKKHGKHTVYAKPNKGVPIPEGGVPVTLKIRETVTAGDNGKRSAEPVGGNGHKVATVTNSAAPKCSSMESSASGCSGCGVRAEQ
jgi:7,8-dihydro-6-hydroxymethylpterin dimethyltransferase